MKKDISYQVDKATTAINKIKNVIASLTLIAIAASVILFIQQLDDHRYSKGMKGATLSYETCRVVSIIDQALKNSTYSEQIQVGSQSLKVIMLSGKHKGETLPAQNYLSNYNSVVAQQGQKLTVVVDELKSGKFQVRVHNYNRAPYLYLFAALFLLTIILVSGKKGLMSCLSLIYTFVCIIFIFLPLIMRGYSPIWAAIALVILVTSANMIFLNGISKKTLCAISGTAGGVLLSGIILLVFSNLVHISGFNLEAAESLLFIRQKTGLGVENILFAGILIAAMGAVMDTAISIVSAIHELHNNRPDLQAMPLFKAGMNVGKDMIGTMSNTLILAFTGAALSTVVILDFYSVQYNQLINSNLVAIEVAQALSGSMGIVLTIPLTASITATMLTKKILPNHNTVEICHNRCNAYSPALKGGHKNDAKTGTI